MQLAEEKKLAEDKKQQKKSSWFAHLSKTKEDKEKEKEEKKKAQAPTKLMAKGVGYSNYLQKGWDVKAYMAAQKEKDKQIELVLGKIYQELKKLHGSHQLSSRNLPVLINALDGASGTTRKRNLFVTEASRIFPNFFRRRFVE